MSETTTTTDEPRTMGEFLRSYMQAHGFSQAGMARALDLSPREYQTAKEFYWLTITPGSIRRSRTQ